MVSSEAPLGVRRVSQSPSQSGRIPLTSELEAMGCLMPEEPGDRARTWPPGESTFITATLMLLDLGAWFEFLFQEDLWSPPKW